MNVKIIFTLCLIFALNVNSSIAKDWNNPIDIGNSWKNSKTQTRDFDNDGDLDIIVIGQQYDAAINSYSYAGILYRNDGMGSFNQEELLGLDIAANSRKVTKIDARDFDGDGLDDLIYTFSDDNMWINTFAVYTNNGDGSSWTEKLYEQNYKGDFAIADFDVDGDNDFVFSESYHKKKLYTFINDGSANFTGTSFEDIGDDIDPSTGSAVTPRSSKLAAIDINNDNNPDLVSIYFNTIPHDVGVLQVFTNNGNAVFAESQNLVSDENTNTEFNVNESAVIIPFHLNVDNNMDFIMAAGAHSWSYISDGLGSFSVNKTDLFEWTINTIGQHHIADVNDDGANDILLNRYNYISGDSKILKVINNGNLTFTSSVIDDTNPLNGQPTAGNYLKPSRNEFLLADFDGDGFVDLNIFASSHPSTVTRYGGFYKTSCYPAAEITNTNKISDTEYQFLASVDNQGCDPITERGFVWSTTENPTLVSNQGTIAVGSGNGTYDYNITNLQIGPGYYVRAYAKNIQGTSYSDSVHFGVVPTLPEWGLIILGMGVLLSSGWFIFKKVL